MFGCAFFFSRGEVYVFVWFELSDTQPCTHTPLTDSILHAALITEENKNRKNNTKISFCTDTHKNQHENLIFEIKALGEELLKLQQTRFFYRPNAKMVFTDFFFFFKPSKECTSGKKDEIKAVTSNPEHKPQLSQGKQVKQATPLEIHPQAVPACLSQNRLF